jgi:hypothetical protein
MVSNSLNMDLKELLQILKRLRRKYGDDPEYRKLRGALPHDWPV